MKINKKGQQVLGMSFGMIFSILLIIFFIIIAFIVIRSFLETRDCAKIGIFSDNLEGDVKRAWNSQKSGFDFKGSLPRGIDYICFANLSMNVKGEHSDKGRELGIYEGYDADMFLYPIEKTCNMGYYKIEHLDMEEMIGVSNPFCIPVDKGVVKLRVEKEFNERFVSVGRV